MSVLIIQHADSEGPGLIADYLDSVGKQWKVVQIPEHPVPDATSHDALVILGGPQSVNDSDTYLKEERMMIRKALMLKKPVLGICLGAQQLALIANGKVHPSSVKEYGLGTVESTGESLFSSFPKRFPVVQWHEETFDLGDATLVVRGSAVKNQAFTFQSGVGLQFHLEVTEPMIREWVEINQKDLDAQNIDPRSIINEYLEHKDELKRLCFDFCQKFFS